MMKNKLTYNQVIESYVKYNEVGINRNKKCINC